MFHNNKQFPVLRGLFLCTGSSCVCRGDQSIALISPDCCCGLFLSEKVALLLSVYLIAFQLSAWCVLASSRLCLGTECISAREHTQPEPERYVCFPFVPGLRGRENLAAIDSRAGSPLCKEKEQ